VDTRQRCYLLRVKKSALPPVLANAPIGPPPSPAELEAMRKHEERRATGERGISHDEAKRRLENHLRGRARRAASDR
jgi:hypothetical protein